MTDKEKTLVIKKTLPYYKAFNTDMGAKAHIAYELFWYDERYDAVALGKNPWVFEEPNNPNCHRKVNQVDFVGFEFKVSKSDLLKLKDKPNYGEVFPRFILVVHKDIKDVALKLIEEYFPTWGLWVCLNEKGAYRYIKEPVVKPEKTYSADMLYRFMMAYGPNRPILWTDLDVEFFKKEASIARKELKYANIALYVNKKFADEIRQCNKCDHYKSCSAPHWFCDNHQKEFYSISKEK